MKKSTSYHIDGPHSDGTYTINSQDPGETWKQLATGLNLEGVMDVLRPHLTDLERVSFLKGRKPCECGCGRFPKGADSRFMQGHDLIKAYQDRPKSK
jgi:hypothetical protein